MSDLISRQDAIDFLKETFKGTIIGTQEALKAIDRVPSAQLDNYREVNRMTANEAIYALKSMKNASVNSFHTDALDMAIKALEAQQNIEEQLDNAYAHGYTEAEAKYYEALKKAQQWIPVSERLPDEEKDVLVTVHFAGLTQKHKSGWNDHIKPKNYVEVAHHIDGEWFSYSDEYKVAKSQHTVIAWMPLPEPYKKN